MRRLTLVLLAVFGLIAAPGAQGSPQADAQKKAADAEFLKGAYLEDTPDLVKPKAILDVKPKYTPDAMRAKLQGKIGVQAIVLPDGTVGRARVFESLDQVMGLDESALAAIKQWRFEAGVLNGQKVPVAVTVYLEFRLH